MKIIFVFISLWGLSIALLGEVKAMASLYKSEQDSLNNTEEYENFRYVYDFEEGAEEKIFVDKSNIYDMPDIKSRKIDVLNMGQTVMVTKAIDAVSYDKDSLYSANWYKVEYRKDNQLKSGYIWGANLCIGYRRHKNIDFLIGAEGVISVDDNKVIDMRIIAIANDKVISQYKFMTSGESLGAVYFHIYDNRGVGGVDNIVYAGISGAACGLGKVSYYLLWSNNNFIDLPAIYSVGEEGYYEESVYIFPKDKGGVEDKIIMQYKSMETDEKGNESYNEKKTVYILDNGKITERK